MMMHGMVSRSLRSMEDTLQQCIPIRVKTTYYNKAVFRIHESGSCMCDKWQRIALV